MTRDVAKIRSSLLATNVQELIYKVNYAHVAQDKDARYHNITRYSAWF